MVKRKNQASVADFIRACNGNVITLDEISNIKKVIETREISKCMHCHNFVHEVFSNNGWCELLMRRLDNWLSIPDNCPLPKA